MDEKPQLNLKRFQSNKIKGSYLVKFILYLVVLVCLWFWYNSRIEGQNETKSGSQTLPKDTTNIQFEQIEIEP